MAVQPIVGLRRLTDMQLVSAQFRYSDPEHSIPGLNCGVPDPNAHPTILGYYDETPRGGRKANPDFPFIRCCHCGKRRHWKGHVVRDDREETYIIGASNCGREHYGIRYDAAEKAFKAEQARRKALIRWHNMLKLIPEYEAEVSRLLQSPILGALDLKRDELRRTCPEGFDKLVQIATTAQPMIETREWRDHDAEQDRQIRFERAMAAFEALPSAERRERRDAGLRPEEETTPIYQRTSTPLGNLIGGGFLSYRGDVRKSALDLRAALDAIDTIQKAGTDPAATSDLTRLLREMTDKPKALDEAVGEVTFTPLFFEADNLDRIARWSASEARFTYSRDGSDLIVDHASRGRARIKPLGPVELPRCNTLQASRYIDEDFLPEMADAA